MSHRQEHHGASTIRASRGGGGGGKWILGAIAILLLAGGGYWAYANYGAPQQQAESQFAYDDPIYATDDPLRDTSDASDDGLTAADEPAERSPSTAAPPSAAPARHAAPARATPARATPARAEPVPEATIGVTPINATTADATESEELVITAPQQPTWSRTPSPRRLSALYPERALNRGREGEARLACVVQAAGALDCERVSETPGGFGNAALRVARTFRHTETLADGTSAIGSPVNLRVVFRMEDEQRGQRFASR